MWIHRLNRTIEVNISWVKHFMNTGTSVVMSGGGGLGAVEESYLAD